MRPTTPRENDALRSSSTGTRTLDGGTSRGSSAAPVGHGISEAPIFYFFICSTKELDPRLLAPNDERLKPMSVDENRPIYEAIPTLQQEFIKFMDFETEYVCRLYAPKGNVLERSWLTLRKSLKEQNVTMYDYVVLFPLKLNMAIHLRSWQADICSWMVKRSIKGDRKTSLKKRFCVLAQNFLLYFEKSEPSGTPLGIFAIDFCKIEKTSEMVRKGFKDVKTHVLRFIPYFSFGRGNPHTFELSSDDEGAIVQWYAILNAKQDGWH